MALVIFMISLTLLILVRISRMFAIFYHLLL